LGGGGTCSPTAPIFGVRLPYTTIQVTGYDFPIPQFKELDMVVLSQNPTSFLFKSNKVYN